MIEIGAPSRGPRDVAVSGTDQLPQRVGVLPLRDTVTFPDMLIPLNVGQERSIELINDVLRGDRSIAMVASNKPEEESPGPEDLYSVGVLGSVARMIRVPDGTLRVLIQGGQRVRIENWLETEPYLVAEVAERHPCELGRPDARDLEDASSAQWPHIGRTLPAHFCDGPPGTLTRPRGD